MLFFTLVQLVVPLIPQYATTITSDPFLIGFAVASISLTAILLRPLSGVISDKWSRSILMILGLIFASAAYFILLLSDDVLHIVIARLIEGAGVASFIPSSIASAVDQAPEGKLGTTLGWRSMMIGIGFIIGPAAGGILAYVFSYGTDAKTGFKTTFGLTSILLLFLIPLVIFGGPKRHSSHSVLRSHGLRERGFIISLSALIVYSLAWMGMLTFLSSYLTQLGYTSIEIALFLIIQAIFSLTLRIFAGKAADKRPEMMTYLGLLVISLALLVVYLTQLPPYVYIAAPIFGIGSGTYIPGSQTMALMKAPTDSRGFLSSVYTMGMDIGNLIGPVIFGLIIQFTGSYQDVFALAPALAFTAAMVVFIPTWAYRRKADKVSALDHSSDR